MLPQSNFHHRIDVLNDASINHLSPWLFSFSDVFCYYYLSDICDTSWLKQVRYSEGPTLGFSLQGDGLAAGRQEKGDCSKFRDFYEASLCGRMIRWLGWILLDQQGLTLRFKACHLLHLCLLLSSEIRSFLLLTDSFWSSLSTYDFDSGSQCNTCLPFFSARGIRPKPFCDRRFWSSLQL